jgi:hypothetical protein
MVCASGFPARSGAQLFGGDRWTAAFPGIAVVSAGANSSLPVVVRRSSDDDE